MSDDELPKPKRTIVFLSPFSFVIEDDHSPTRKGKHYFKEICAKHNAQIVRSPRWSKSSKQYTTEILVDQGRYYRFMEELADEGYIFEAGFGNARRLYEKICFKE